MESSVDLSKLLLVLSSVNKILDGFVRPRNSSGSQQRGVFPCDKAAFLQWSERLLLQALRGKAAVVGASCRRCEVRLQWSERRLLQALRGKAAVVGASPAAGVAR